MMETSMIEDTILFCIIIAIICCIFIGMAWYLTGIQNKINQGYYGWEQISFTVDGKVQNNLIHKSQYYIIGNNNKYQVPIETYGMARVNENIKLKRGKTILWMNNDLWILDTR